MKQLNLKNFQNILRKKFLKLGVKMIGPERLTHWADDSKKSWHDQYFFLFKNKDAIIVECYNWSENVPWKDHLRVRITTNEFLNFLQKE